MITLRNVCAGYDGQDVLHDISFTIEKGESLSIIGPNGCGKTTLLRAMAKLIAFRGEILLEGQPLAGMKRGQLAKRIAMLSQITQAYFNYTVYDTVMMGRYVHTEGGIWSTPAKADLQAVEQALQAVGLTPLANRTVDSLSGGQLQRVFLAKLLAQQPDIILLDEPTNHLDISSQIELVRFLKRWCAQGGRTVIGVLHDINLAMQLSERLLLLHEGRIAALGPGRQIAASPVLREVYGMDIAGFMLQALKYWEETQP